MIELLSHYLYVLAGVAPYLGGVFLLGILCGGSRPTLRASLESLGFSAVFIFLASCLEHATTNTLGPAHLWTSVTIHFPETALGQVGLSVATLATHDFLDYWTHRAMHSPLLWRFHALHHKAEEFNPTIAYRIHPVELLVVSVPGILLTDVLSMQGGDYHVAKNIPVLLLFWGQLNHADGKIEFGILSPVFTGPQYHRIHHSNRPEHVDCNFAGRFPVFDVLFGTYVPCTPGLHPETGLTRQV